MALLVLAYAGQLHMGRRDQRTLYDFHQRGTILALSMHDAYVAARAEHGPEGGVRPADAGAFIAAATVAFGRTVDFGDQLLSLYARHPAPPFDAGRRRLERAVTQLRALRQTFGHDDLGFAQAFAARPLYIGVVGLQLARLHTIAAKDLSAAIDRRTYVSWILFAGSALLLLSGLALLARRHLRAIDAILLREAATMDALRRSEARLEEAQRVAQLGSWELEPASGRMSFSAEARRILGIAEPSDGADRGVFLNAIHPEDREAAAALLAEQAESQRPRERELRLLPGDGPEKLVHLRGWDSVDGTVRRSFGTLQDISERRAMEGQLLQFQKMESVGRLAGGVAHDFNNLLTAISANLSLALEGLAADDPRHEFITEAAKAASSAAEVTRQLLTFSRRQVINPKVLALNDVIAGVQRIVQRLIGEDIALRFVLQPGLGRVRMDPVQLEQILINLAVNARDAMPAGGRLTIETADVTLDDEHSREHPHMHPGAFVMVAVSDTGTGFSDEDKAHLFEPFYTTKAKSRGTGLGLPMVYGAVKQHGGSIEVFSEAGAGATFRIYLPRVDEEPEPRPAGAAPGLSHGTETIVLVEDQDSVRNVTARLLRRLGYTVHVFATAEEALAAVAEMAAPVHLLLTDVVLPAMNGRVLADHMRILRPDIKVLFSSGYSENLIAHRGVLEPDIEFLSKPYSIRALAERVREVLDGDDA
jgi:signal transduction histidine kinase/CheY-like chemotaxis protein